MEPDLIQMFKDGKEKLPAIGDTAMALLVLASIMRSGLYSIGCTIQEGNRPRPPDGD